MQTLGSSRGCQVTGGARPAPFASSGLCRSVSLGRWGHTCPSWRPRSREPRPLSSAEHLVACNSQRPYVLSGRKEGGSGGQISFASVELRVKTETDMKWERKANHISCTFELGPGTAHVTRLYPGLLTNPKIRVMSFWSSGSGPSAVTADFRNTSGLRWNLASTSPAEYSTFPRCIKEGGQKKWRDCQQRFGDFI